MITAAFLNHGYLVEREVITALKRCRGVRLVCIETASRLTPEQAAVLQDVLKRHQCMLVFTINDWGLDLCGSMREFFLHRSMVHVNWYVDDPFFPEIMFGHFFPPAPNRLDFVSDRGAVALMQQRGYRVSFLPLATDTSLFQPHSSHTITRRRCFVGNSYRHQMDTLLQHDHGYCETILPALSRLLDNYRDSMRMDIDAASRSLVAHHPPPPALPLEKAALLCKLFVGYVFRKSCIVDLVKTYPDLMVFGDPRWAEDIPVSNVSTLVGYYTNLCETYGQTAVNVDINRVVIRDGFTQRVFDCLASGGCLLTSDKAVVHDVFETSGPNRDLVVFHNPHELREFMDHFSNPAHETERRRIAQRGMRTVREHHTYDHRVQTMFTRIRDMLGDAATARR